MRNNNLLIIHYSLRRSFTTRLLIVLFLESAPHLNIVGMDINFRNMDTNFKHFICLYNISLSHTTCVLL